MIPTPPGPPLTPALSPPVLSPARCPPPSARGLPPPPHSSPLAATEVASAQAASKPVGVDPNRTVAAAPDACPAPFRSSLYAASPTLLVSAGVNDSRQQQPQPTQQTGGATTSPAAPAPTPVPLTSGEKMERAFRRAFLSPFGYARTALSAAITQAGEEDLPHKTTGDKVADGLSRFAIKFSSRATRTMLGSGVFPALFRQDPRYHPSGKKGFAARAFYAASRVVVTRGDDGSQQPNYSRIAGSLSASALSNLWERSTPGRDRVGADATFRRFRNSFVDDALINVIREFWPDIRKILGR